MATTTDKDCSAEQERSVEGMIREAQALLQQDAQERTRLAQQQVEVILREHRVRLEPHITITPRGQYAELHFIPE